MVIFEYDVINFKKLEEFLMNNNSNNKNVLWIDRTGSLDVDSETTYYIEGVKANFCLFTNSLQVIFKITDVFKSQSYYMLQDYIINSPEFDDFIGYLYSGGQDGIIEINTDDVDAFYYYGKLKYRNNQYELDFDTLEPIQTAVSHLYIELYEEKCKSSSFEDESDDEVYFEDESYEDS